jgi:hypothetical protein
MSERNEEDPILKLVYQLRGYLQCQASLSHTAGSGNGQQANIAAQQQMLHSRKNGPATDQRAALARQVVWSSIQRLERWEIKWQTGDDELENVLRLL